MRPESHDALLTPIQIFPSSGQNSAISDGILPDVMLLNDNFRTDSWNVL